VRQWPNEQTISHSTREKVVITPEQLVQESEALIKLLNDPRFAAPKVQRLIERVINELAYVNGGDAPPVSQVLLNDLAQGLL
jgi:hypothetical protein